MSERLRAWLGTREGVLLAVAGLAAAGVAVLAGALALHADLSERAARVAAGERDLAMLRRLAADLGPAPAATPSSGPSLMTRLETAAAAVVGRPRIAAMTPTTTPVADGLREERVAVRLAGTSLGELVRLLHGLGSADPPIEVARLELRKHPDDPRHFDATVEVARILPDTP
jgi:hypothetical protein